MSQSWYNLHVVNQVAEIDIFEDIAFFGITAKTFSEDLKDLGDFSEIIVNINSPGGDVFEGLAIFNILRGLNKKVIVNINGIAASIASVIALAGDEINIADNGFFFVHQVSGGAFGTADDIEKTAEDIRKIQDQIVNIYINKTGLSKEKITQLMEDESLLTAEEAKELGFVDNITEGLKVAASVSKDMKLNDIHKSFKNNVMNDDLKKAFDDLKSWITDLTNKKPEDTDEKLTEEFTEKITALETDFQAKLDETSKSQDETLTEKDTIIAEKDENIKAREEVLAKNDTTIKELEAKITELEKEPLGTEPKANSEGDKKIDWKNLHPSDIDALFE